MLVPANIELVQGEPRVHDLRLAECLGFARPRTIRQLIERNEDELSAYGGVCRTVQQTSPLGGRPAKEYWLTEPQALLICMFADTTNAAGVRKALIEVFMAWRREQVPQRKELAMLAVFADVPDALEIAVHLRRRYQKRVNVRFATV